MTTNFLDYDTILTEELVAQILDPEPGNPIHYNLRMLSYSGRLLLRSCPRKYELNKMQPRVKEGDDEAGHLIFGTVVGNGIQELLVSGDMNRATIRMFLDWKDYLDSERGIKSSKTFWHAMVALRKFAKVRSEQLGQYEVATFNEKPATELGFRIKCGFGFDYRGKLDALLIHRTKREFLVMECKTTGFARVDEAMYKNSDQAVGYGIIIDAVAHQMEMENNSYDVLYPVYMTKVQEWELFRFPKSNNARALWLQSLLLEVSQIQQYHTFGYFPTHGESCYSYNRQCAHFGTCGLSNSVLIGDEDKVAISLDKDGDYPLEFTIAELIEAQLGKE